MVNVTAAVSDRRRGKRPPRPTAYAYVQRRAAPGVTRHYTFAAMVVTVELQLVLLARGILPKILGEGLSASGAQTRC